MHIHPQKVSREGGGSKDPHEEGRRLPAHCSRIVITVPNQSHSSIRAAEWERGLQLVREWTWGEWCVTPVTGSAYRKAWDWPGAISVCRRGRGGRKWVDLHPFDSISQSTSRVRGWGRGEAVCEHQKIIAREQPARCAANFDLFKCLVQCGFRVLVFATVALDAQCF